MMTIDVVFILCEKCRVRFDKVRFERFMENKQVAKCGDEILYYLKDVREYIDQAYKL